MFTSDFLNCYLPCQFVTVREAWQSFDRRKLPGQVKENESASSINHCPQLIVVSLRLKRVSYAYGCVKRANCAWQKNTWLVNLVHICQCFCCCCQKKHSRWSMCCCFYVVSASHDFQLKNCGYELSADVCACPVNEQWSEQSKALRAREEL